MIYAFVVDPLDGSLNQTFERAKVTRAGDCELEVATESEDKRVLKAHLTLAGEAISGEASVAQFPILDPESGDPRVVCTAEHVKVIGKRVGD